MLNNHFEILSMSIISLMCCSSVSGQGPYLFFPKKTCIIGAVKSDFAGENIKEKKDSSLP